MPSVHTIPAGAPFLDVLARGLIARAGEDPLALARATVLLPTRRAARSLAASLLRESGGGAALAPRALALADLDDGDAWADPDPAARDGVPPAIAPLERLVRLADLVRARPEIDGNPAAATRLAASLAALLDSAALEDASLAKLDAVVPGELAAHWQRSLEALEAARARWPVELARLGRVDPAERQVRLLRARAARWRASPPSGLVVAAGSTGSVPATAELLAVVAGLPDGHVVLPGLDRALDAASWEAAAEDPCHPQHALARLLPRLGVKRAAVGDWVSGVDPSPRAALLAEALRPAATTSRWRDAPATDDAAFAGLGRVAAADPDEEAGAIALAMRGALEAPERTAALVTPDRALARRVAAALGRWGVEVDDSAGVALPRAPHGAFLMLAAEAAAEGAPVPLLALLKHGLARTGQPRAELARLVRRLDRRILRRPAPPRGLAALARVEDAALGGMLGALAAAAAPFSDLLAAAAAPPRALLQAHVAFAEWIATGPDALEASALWSGDAGEAAARFVRELDGALEAMAPIRGAAWPALFAELAGAVVVRPRAPRHPRLAIWGPLEARLQSADLLVLGGLNEGTWPPASPEDPWLSRGMRRALGLPAAERRVGLSAHDFVMTASSGAALLTRSLKVEGTPTRPARWLQRLEAVCGEDKRWRATAVTPWIHWRGLLDRDEPDLPRPVAPPRPRPPVAARPRRLSATEVETWIRDPYAIYARRVLGLAPLDPLDPEPSGADRGSLVHTALAEFHAARRADASGDALATLLACGRRAFGPLLDRPAVRAIWWPRFERLARWLVAWEARRAADGHVALAAEVTGALALAGPAGAFELRARADRIDRLADAGIAILDWKTGALPGLREMAIGLAPQLGLEGAIAAAGGFAAVAAAVPSALIHVRLTGGEPPGFVREYRPPRDMPAHDVPALVAEARRGLERLIAEYDREESVYLSRPRPKFVSHAGDYDVLARVSEWSAALGDEG